MNNWVTPTSTLFPTIEDAVPTILLENIAFAQNCVITKAEPPIPENNLTIDSPTPVWTNPVHAVGIDANTNIHIITHLAPYLSHNGPTVTRNTVANGILAMEDVHISCLDKSNESRTSGSNGAMANQFT